MALISQNVYIDRLDDVVNKYSNTCHSTIKMKPADVKPSAYIDSSKEINYQDPKFEIGDIFRISKYKNTFAKGYVSNWSEEVFVIKNVKNAVPWTYFIGDLKDEKIVEIFFRKRIAKKLIKKSLQLKK